VAVVIAGVLLAACSTGAPEVPSGPDGSPDPVLVQGREVWSARCAGCHGAAGGGGSGPAVSDGRMVSAYPDIADQIAVVVNGRGAMPGFGSALSAEDIEAVVRYTREVL
jgi:cytochrome c oxidase subunit II